MLEADRLALLFEEQPLAGSGKSVSSNPYKELRYLVIDDQDASRQTLKICIQSMGGFSVDQAQSFNEAHHRMRGQMPDVIICDYILGSGRTGQQLLEDLRRADRLPDTVAFLMVTAERSYEQVVSAVELAPDDYIIKPFSPEMLRTRMDRVIRKKVFFRHFYELKRNGDFGAALAELDTLNNAGDSKPYRFDVMRARAETLLKADRAQDALDNYTSIVEIHPFPWALAGQARALQQLNRHEEASHVIDGVLAAAPSYFEAYDLKADICCDLGKFDKAQQILQEVAERTPRNWQRKRTLSALAKLNGDFDTAQRLLEEVIASDHVAGVSISDRIELVRTALAGGNKALAEKTLAELTPEEKDALPLEERLSIECLTAMMAGGDAGARGLERIRADLGRAELHGEALLDGVRAALLFSDLQLADLLAEKLLGGLEARRFFRAMREIFCDHDMEDHFRQLQRTVAARRLQRKQ
jgi:CheY-like chemotaxis protein